MRDFRKRGVVIFDLDGTITDPGLGIANAARHALATAGIAENDPARLRRFIGPPLSRSFPEYYGMDEKQTVACVAAFREYYAENGLHENTLYPGMAELIADLRCAGRRILLATSKPEQFARHILESFDLAKHFDFIGGSTMDESRVEKSHVIAHSLAGSGVLPKACVMVGDRRHDVDGAAVHGIPCIGVLYGYGSSEELHKAGAAVIAESVPALRSILLG